MDQDELPILEPGKDFRTAPEPDDRQIRHDARRQRDPSNIADRWREGDQPQRAAVEARDREVGLFVAVEIRSRAETERTLTDDVIGGVRHLGGFRQLAVDERP